MRLLGLSRRPPPPMPTPAEVTPGLLEAQRAHAAAKEHLMDAIYQGPEVRAVAARVAEHARRNNFGGLAQNVWEGWGR